MKQGAPPNVSEEDIARLEVENGLRQFDLAVETIQQFLEPYRPFALRPSLIQEMQAVAVEGIQQYPGRWRTHPVKISGSKHTPPPAYLVENKIVEMCDYVNGHLHEETPFHLASFIMWRLNWIHPFDDGNGRTSRAISYIVLCVALRQVLPGSPTIPEQIQENRAPYFAALEAADDAFLQNEEIDVTAMEAMLRDMLAKQLLSIIDKAGGQRLT